MIKKTRATRNKEQDDQGNKKKRTIRKEQDLKPPVSVLTTNPQHPAKPTPPDPPTSW